MAFTLMRVVLTLRQKLDIKWHPRERTMRPWHRNPAPGSLHFGSNVANAPKVFRPHHHEPRPQAQREKWKADDDRRGSSASRGYGTRWQKARATFLMRHPLCVCHLANGKVEPAGVVDHIVPHKGDQSLFWDSGNWQALCDDCHKRIKASVEDAYLKGDATVEDLRLDREMPELFF